MQQPRDPNELRDRLAGSKVVMPGYHAVHGTKCVANREILNDILRDYVGFDGMVVSDYTAIDQLPDMENSVQKAAAAINGGNDVEELIKTGKPVVLVIFGGRAQIYLSPAEGQSIRPIQLQQTISLTGEPVTKPIRDYYFSKKL